MEATEQVWTDFYLQPGRFLEAGQLDRLACELRGLDDCSGRRLGDPRKVLDHRALVLARRPDGQLVACSSARPARRSGRSTLEIAPTVVAPGHDEARLGRSLEADLVRTFLERQHPFGRVWIRTERAGHDARPISLLSLLGTRLQDSLYRRIDAALPGIQHALQ